MSIFCAGDHYWKPTQQNRQRLICRHPGHVASMPRQQTLLKWRRSSIRTGHLLLHQPQHLPVSHQLWLLLHNSRPPHLLNGTRCSPLLLSPCPTIMLRSPSPHYWELLQPSNHHARSACKKEILRQPVIWMRQLLNLPSIWKLWLRWYPSFRWHPLTCCPAGGCVANYQRSTYLMWRAASPAGYPWRDCWK